MERQEPQRTVLDLWYLYMCFFFFFVLRFHVQLTFDILHITQQQIPRNYNDSHNCEIYSMRFFFRCRCLPSSSNHSWPTTIAIEMIQFNAVYSEHQQPNRTQYVRKTRKSKLHIPNAESDSTYLEYIFSLIIGAAMLITLTDSLENFFPCCKIHLKCSR